MLVVVQIERESIVAASLSKSNRALFVCLFMNYVIHLTVPIDVPDLLPTVFQNASNIFSPSYVTALLSFLSSAVLEISHSYCTNSPY